MKLLCRAGKSNAEAKRQVDELQETIAQLRGQVEALSKRNAGLEAELKSSRAAPASRPSTPALPTSGEEPMQR